MVMLLEAPCIASWSLCCTLRPKFPCSSRWFAKFDSCSVRIILAQRTGIGKKERRFGRWERTTCCQCICVTGATLQILAFAKMAAPNVCGFFLKNFGIFFKDGSKWHPESIKKIKNSLSYFFVRWKIFCWGIINELVENYADHGEYEHHIFIIKSILFDLDFF